MEQKSRILILTTAYLPEVGGSELAIKNITDKLGGFCFDLITTRSSKNLLKEEKIGNVSVYRVGGLLGLFSFLLPKNFFPVFVFLKALQLIRKNNRYNAIHAYQASQAAGGGWMLKLVYPKIPFLVTLQEGKNLDSQSWLTKFFRRFILKKADVITVISDYLAKYAKWVNPKAKAVLIPNGVDIDKFQVSNHKSQTNSNNQIQNIKTVITVSRLVEKNGVGDLIEAFYILNNRYKPQVASYKLVIIGDGPLHENLEFRIADYELRDHVKIIGKVLPDEVPKYLAKADVFVRPSLSEGLGTAFLEAMAAGVPVIGTSVGGIPDFLKDPLTHARQATGLFCKANNPEDLAEKMHKVLSDDDLKENLTTNARKLVEEKYNWDKIADQFKNLYDSI